MNNPLSEIPRLMAVQHRLIKDLKKKAGLRQRDLEVLCACYMLSKVNYPFTAAKLHDYLQESYFLHSLYDSIKVLIDKLYIKIIVPGKPFRPEGYELTYKGREVIREFSDEIWRLSGEQEYDTTGKSSRLW